MFLTYSSGPHFPRSGQSKGLRDSSGRVTYRRSPLCRTGVFRCPIGIFPIRIASLRSFRLSETCQSCPFAWYSTVTTVGLSIPLRERFVTVPSTEAVHLAALFLRRRAAKWRTRATAAAGMIKRKAKISKIQKPSFTGKSPPFLQTSAPRDTGSRIFRLHGVLPYDRPSNCML